MARRPHTTSRTLVALAGAISTSPATAQSASELGGSTLQQVCHALGSPLIVLVFVIAIVGAMALLVLGPPNSHWKWSYRPHHVLSIVMGAGVILGIGTVIAMLGLTGNCNVL